MPNNARLTTTFRFCATELDTSKNTLFRFTNASSTNYRLGDTSSPLDKVLGELNSGIVCGYWNQYFCESGGIKFSAAYMIQAERLIRATMQLPTNEVKETLKLNRT